MAEQELTKDLMGALEETVAAEPDKIASLELRELMDSVAAEAEEPTLILETLLLVEMILVVVILLVVMILYKIYKIK